MQAYLDWVFTQLSLAAKLISLALVSEDGREFYVELLDSWSADDCSDFVIEVVLPQLWGGAYAMPMLAASEALLAFLEGFTEMVEIVTDAPQYDWELFCELAYCDGQWPGNVRNMPTDATTLDALNDGEPLPHHALLDAGMFADDSSPRPETRTSWLEQGSYRIFSHVLADRAARYGQPRRSVQLSQASFGPRPRWALMRL